MIASGQCLGEALPRVLNSQRANRPLINRCAQTRRTYCLERRVHGKFAPFRELAPLAYHIPVLRVNNQGREGTAKIHPVPKPYAGRVVCLREIRDAVPRSKSLIESMVTTRAGVWVAG